MDWRKRYQDKLLYIKGRIKEVVARVYAGTYCPSPTYYALLNNGEEISLTDKELNHIFQNKDEFMPDF